MRIKNVKIKGFRSINSTGVEFTVDSIAAFIGRNSAGKSNLLEALDYFFNNNSILPPEDHYQKSTEEAIEITIDFQLEEETEYDVVVHANNEKILKIRKIYNFGQKPEIEVLGCWKYTQEDDFNPQGKYTVTNIRRILAVEDVQSFLTENFSDQEVTTPAQYTAVLKEYWGKNIEHMPKEWDNTPQIAAKETLSALPAYYYLPVTYTVNDETKLVKNSRFQAIYNHILGNIESLVDDDRTKQIQKQVELLYKKSGIEKRRSDVNKILASIDNTNSGTNMHLEFAPVDLRMISQRIPTVMINDGYDSDINSKGHGIQRDAIFRLLRAYLKLKNVDKRNNFILAVDEPELYMHPTYKRALYSSFLELSQSGCQIMYTTHDPAFVSVAHFDDIHVVRKDQTSSLHTSVTSCSLKRIKKTEVFKKNFEGKKDSAIRMELQHKCHGEQNEGFFADKVIIVEGATEQYALPVYFRKVGFDLDNANIAVVTAESVTLVAQLCTIFSALSIPCYCIFDGDKPKDSIYEKYLKYRSGEIKVSKEEKQKYIGVSKTLTRNQDIVKCISGQMIEDFSGTTISDNYTMWERNFEIDVHEKVRGYVKIRDDLVRNNGIQAESKPLVAAEVAEYYSLKASLPKSLNQTIKDIAQKIQAAKCIDLRYLQDAPTFSIHNEQLDGLLPVFSCAAGRNTIVEADAAIGYAEGDFLASTDCLVHIQGDSMETLIPNDSYVAVKYETNPTPGDFVICMLDGGEMVCKQYIRYENEGSIVHKLKSVNHNYPDIILSDECPGRMVGIVLKKERKPLFYQLDD